jgi:hypothetical protein
MGRSVSKMFSKVLVARHSPENQCNAQNGEILILKPRGQVPIDDHVAHYFLSGKDRKTKSKYGWVKEVEPFSLNDFIEQNHLEAYLNEEDGVQMERMFSKIGNLPPDTPVAATYSRRGIERKHMELTVHKVFFYKTSTREQGN